jgi:hypothetical protein
VFQRDRQPSVDFRSTSRRLGKCEAPGVIVGDVSARLCS